MWLSVHDWSNQFGFVETFSVACCTSAFWKFTSELHNFVHTTSNYVAHSISRPDVSPAIGAVPVLSW